MLRRVSQTAALVAAYKAKVLASALWVSGLELDCERAPEISAESYRLLRLFRARVDRERKEVEVSFFGRVPRRASFQPGFGATLGAPPASGPLPAIASAPGLLSRPAPALEPVLDAAFAEPRRGSLKRTRAVVILQGGAVAAERYAPGIGPRTPLNGWSMTKSVMGALIGTLVAENRLSLSSSRLLPQWESPGDPRGRITLEDLLRMRSGLRFSEVYSDALSDVSRMLFLEPDAAGYAASLPMDAAPGAKWNYASGTSNILSLIARGAVGEPAYPSWPRCALFDPIGMETAVFERDAAGSFVGSSFLFASARDWARFGLLTAQDGVWARRRLLPAGWMAFCSRPTPQSDKGRYGAHWWLKLPPELGGESPAAARLPADAIHALGHEGQCLTVIPSRRLVVLRLGLTINIKAWDHAAFLASVLDAR